MYDLREPIAVFGTAVMWCVTDDQFLKPVTLASLILVGSLANASEFSQPLPLTESQWDKVGERISLLDKITYIPSLLPIIMKNRDALGLSDAQIARFREWRRENYDRMVDLMNGIIERRIAIAKMALDPAQDAHKVLAEQKAIFQMQEELLTVRLSCRDLVMTTFTHQQWSNFAFILEDYPSFAGLMPE